MPYYLMDGHKTNIYYEPHLYGLEEVSVALEVDRNEYDIWTAWRDLIHPDTFFWSVDEGDFRLTDPFRGMSRGDLTPAKDAWELREALDLWSSPFTDRRQAAIDASKGLMELIYGQPY